MSALDQHWPRIELWKADLVGTNCTETLKVAADFAVLVPDEQLAQVITRSTSAEATEFRKAKWEVTLCLRTRTPLGTVRVSTYLRLGPSSPTPFVRGSGMHFARAVKGVGVRVWCSRTVGGFGTEWYFGVPSRIYVARIPGPTSVGDTEPLEAGIRIVDASWRAAVEVEGDWLAGIPDEVRTGKRRARSTSEVTRGARSFLDVLTRHLSPHLDLCDANGERL